MKLSECLQQQNIKLQLPSMSQDEAISYAGQLLVQSGYVDSPYVTTMFEREEVVSTYIGHGIAIPHGMPSAQPTIHTSGIVILQFPQGIIYNGNNCYLVIGISGKKEEHIQILKHIATVLSDEQVAKELWTTTNHQLVYDTFTKGDKS